MMAGFEGRSAISARRGSSLRSCLPGGPVRQPAERCSARLLVALVGFYVGLTTTMYGHLGEVTGEVTGVPQSFRFVLGANRIWFAAGLMSGPGCGLVSGFLGARLRTVWLTLLLGLLL